MLTHLTDTPIGGLATAAIHAGLRPDPTTGAVAPPIVLSTVFEYPEGEPATYSYSRHRNPNRDALEVALARLEGGHHSLAFASGMAAITVLFQALPAGSHVIVPAEMYHGARLGFHHLFRELLQVETVDQRDLVAVRRAFRPNTRMVWIESPSNPKLEITDVEALCGLAHDHGALAAVDNTWATPLCQLPFRLGADIVVHSLSKYFGGHSDLLSGAVVFREASELADRVRLLQWNIGAVPAPFDCWLLRRGVMSFPVRMRAHCANAEAMAHWLRGREEVGEVYFPGFADHPGHEIARRQMSGWGGMVSFTMRGGERAARRLPRLTKVIVNATSLGGIESLMEHRASAEGPMSPTRPDLVRFSVGLEDVPDLQADLSQAFERLSHE